MGPADRVLDSGSSKVGSGPLRLRLSGATQLRIRLFPLSLVGQSSLNEYCPLAPTGAPVLSPEAPAAPWGWPGPLLPLLPEPAHPLQRYVSTPCTGMPGHDPPPPPHWHTSQHLRSLGLAPDHSLMSAASLPLCPWAGVPSSVSLPTPLRLERRQSRGEWPVTTEGCQSPLKRAMTCPWHTAGLWQDQDGIQACLKDDTTEIWFLGER